MSSLLLERQAEVTEVRVYSCILPFACFVFKELYNKIFMVLNTSLATPGAHLVYVDDVAKMVSENATKEIVLVLKSTVPVGTNKRVRNIVKDSEHMVHVVSNPEFLKEGEAVNDFLRPDRIVVGVSNGDEHARTTMHRLYHPVCLNTEKIVWMNPESAEMTKYVANTMLAMRISFMNEVAGMYVTAQF